MNKYTKLWAALIAASAFVACQQGDDIVPPTPDTPEQPTTGYRLTFDGGVGNETATRAHWTDPNGSGSLFFNWDYTSSGEDGNEMVMAFYKEKFIASTTGNYHTYASIHRHSDPEKQQDNHYASFTTVEKYDSPLSSGDYEDCRVVALTPLRADNDTYIYSLERRVIANLPMPGTFEQNDDQEPDFLSNYMYMYADASITDGNAFLLFEHIPATFRFKITNKRPEPARINSVKVTVVDTEGVEQPVASQFVDVLAASDEDIELSYSTITYTEVTTNINTSLATDEKYTAYALVLPLYGDAPLEGKKIRFTIDASNPDNEYLSFELDAETLANANHGEYNWVGGKSYTINMRLGDVLYFDGVTVLDWYEVEIQGGEAEEDEWLNGINIYTGAYQPATLNAEGAYEIANAGNLMWFDQLATASDVDNTALNAVLTADVDLEGFKWAALGRSSDKPYMGTFDGRGHTISNLSRNAHSNEGSRESFVYYLGAEGVIKNVTFDNADVFCQGHAGANASAVVALRSAGTISCCVVSNARVQLGNYEYLSGIVGLNNGTIENCAVINTSLTRRFGHSHPSAPITHNNQGTVRNCFAYGCTQSANNATNGGIVVSCSTAPANCYYYTTSSVSDAYGTAKAPAEFASATMAELLNADQENGPWEYVTGNDYPTLR